MGFIFVPLQTLALLTVPMHQLSNATAVFSVVRNVGGSVGVAIATALLTRRAQHHQTTLVSHIDAWDPETAERLRQWTDHFLAHGSDAATAARQAVAALYRSTVEQAQVLSFGDDFLLLAIVYGSLVLLIPFMQRAERPGKTLSATGTAAAAEEARRAPPSLPSDPHPRKGMAEDTTPASPTPGPPACRAARSRRRSSDPGPDRPA